MTDFSMPQEQRAEWMNSFARGLGWADQKHMKGDVSIIRGRVEVLDTFSRNAIERAVASERDRCHAIAADLARKMLDGKPRNWRYHHDTAVRIAELISAGANT